MAFSIDPESAYERAAVVAFHLKEGNVMTAQDIASAARFKRVQSAYKLMIHISRVLPVVKVDDSWKVMDES